MTKIHQAIIATFAALIVSQTANADTAAKITFVGGQTVEATLSERSDDESIYLVFEGQSTKIIRKFDRALVASIELQEASAVVSTPSRTGETVATRALHALGSVRPLIANQ